MMKHRRRHPRLLKVKKLQRSFTVEYRSGRRKLNSNPSSIWGDMDLKSVAQDLQDEARPFLTPMSQAGSSEKDLTGEEQSSALLTLPMAQETNVPALQETRMADENITVTDADTAAAATPDVPKKARKPRVKKAAAETTSAAVSAQPAAASNAAAVKPKRGRKAKSDEAATSAKRAPVKRAPKAVQAATAPSVATVDEFADLLQLEEENQDFASCWPRSCVLKTPICESGSISLDRQQLIKPWLHSRGYIETNILAAASPAANALPAACMRGRIRGRINGVSMEISCSAGVTATSAAPGTWLDR